jgi:pimeloyl-ACP methyl ester carboxylesterase
MNCLGQTVQFISVDDNVRLEVLDWGGSGRSVVLLAGQGDTAHQFDSFGRKLASTYHVYGITRRGVGASSSPKIIIAPDGHVDSAVYAADRLGDDVIAVLDALKLNRPVLIAHSLGGEELSSVATRHPEKVAGLIYLDAGFSYAYYNPSRGFFLDEPRFYVDLAELRKKLSWLLEGQQGDNPQLLEELLNTDIPQLEKDLQERQKAFDSGLLRANSHPPALPEVPASPPPGQTSDQWKRGLAMMAGVQKYTDIRVPVLAFFAVPHDRGDDADAALTEAQANAFEKGVSSARVVRLPHGNHAIWTTHESDVLREIHAFIAGLP